MEKKMTPEQDCEVMASTGERFLVDKDDLHLLGNWSWKVHKGVVCRSDWKTKKTVILHRLIMDAPDGMVIDHINHDTLDNRKSNLRICTHQQNIMNSRKRKGNNTSKYKGVSYDKKHKWRMKITKDGISTDISGFDTEEDAARAYNEYAKMLHGEFAYLNDIKDSGMTKEQQKHMMDNIISFRDGYIPKYARGQMEHSGNMWTMGGFQALENMRDEVLDQWSYYKQIERVFDEIRDAIEQFVSPEMEGEFLEMYKAVKEILNRKKEDGK